jgi:hypothetical protein
LEVKALKDIIVDILLKFTKEKRITVSKVILELYAEELIKHNIVIPTRCAECIYLTEDGFCYKDVEGVSYKKTQNNGYCDKGEKHDE